MSMDSGLNNEQLKKAMAQSTSEGMAKVLGKQDLRQEFFREHTYVSNGVKKCATMPHDLFEWFYSKVESKNREIAELKAEREKLAFRITDLLNESIDSGMEIRKLKADILNFKEWYREANAATRVKVLEKLNKIA